MLSRRSDLNEEKPERNQMADEEEDSIKLGEEGKSFADIGSNL